jgi:hypothetical protein
VVGFGERPAALDEGDLLCAAPLEPSLEVRDRPAQSFPERNGGLPAQQALGTGDVGAALGGIVLGQGTVLDLEPLAAQRRDLVRQLPDRELARVAEVHGIVDTVGLHQPDQPADQVVHVAEGAGLLALPVNGERLAAQRLHDEIRDHPPIRFRHPRPVGVEDPGDPDVHPGLAVVIHHERLGHPLAFVVARARADRVHVAPVALRLRVHVGITVDLGGGGLEDAGPDAPGQGQHVERADHVGLDGLDRVVLVVNRGGRTGEVVDLPDREQERLAYIVTQQLEPAGVQQVADVVAPPREEVVQTDDFVTLGDQTLTEMRADESGPTRDQHLHGYAACSDWFEAREWRAGKVREPSLTFPKLHVCEQTHGLLIFGECLGRNGLGNRPGGRAGEGATQQGTGLRSRLNRELGQHVPRVMASGVAADLENPGDFGIGAAVREQQRHVHFARRQSEARHQMLRG